MTDKPTFSKLETTPPALLQAGGTIGGSIKGIRAFDATRLDATPLDANDKKAFSAVPAK